MLNLLRNTVSNFRVSQATEDANNFLAAAGITGQVQSQAIYNLVVDLQTSGLWSKMKAVYPMVTDNYNLLSYTEDFSNALWSKTNTTITANSTTNPFGANTATKLIENSGSGSKYVALTTTSTTVSQTYTFSVYLKAAERSWAIVGQDTLGTGYFWVNLSNGTFGSGAGTYLSRSITSAGNGWYKITVTYSAASTSANGIVFISSADGAVNYTGNGTNGIFISSPQLELGTSTISAYQPILTTPSAFMASQMKYNLKDPRDLDAAFRLTWSGGWTYSATGATPNGTNAFADTKLYPSDLPQDNNSFGFYSRTNIIAFQNDIGASTTYNMAANFNPVGAFARNNSSAFGGFTNADTTGFYYDSRILSTQHKLYKNGSVLGTVVSNSTTPDNLIRIALSAAMQSSNTSAQQFSSKQLAFSFFGTGLSDQDALLINQIVEKYQVALSRGVQAAQSFYYNSAYSNEANTYLYSTQITGTTQVSAINTLINGLKANNLWTKMKAVYPFVTDKWNLFSFTEDLTNVAWSKSNVSATLTGTFLGNNVYKLADTTNTNVVHLIAQGPMIVSNTYTVSVNFKKAEYDYAQIFEGGAVFNLANGTVQSSLGSNATMVDLGDGWYRCSVTVVSGAANIHIAANKTATSGYSYLSTIGYGIFMSAPQIQYGTIASPYQVISGTNSNTINQTAVAAQMKFNLVNPQDTDAAFRLAFSGGWTYSTNGAQPNGTNGYADTKLVPSTAIASVNSNSLGYYSGSNLAETSSDPVNVGSTISGTQAMNILKSNASINSRLNGDILTYVTSIMKGFFVATRPSSSVANLFFNGNKVTTITPNGSLPNYSVLIGTTNFGSTPYAQGYVRNDFRFVFIADGFNDAEIALLNQLTNDFQTTLSRQV
jgi:hypothetical protein